MSDIKELITEIEALRKELVECFESKYLDKDIIVISQKLDVLIVEYMKKKPGHPWKSYLSNAPKTPASIGGGINRLYPQWRVSIPH